MKTKLFFASMMLSACIFTVTANELHPNMPSGRRPCYPSSKCTGDPNLIGPRGGCSANRGENGGNYGGSEEQNMQQNAYRENAGNQGFGYWGNRGYGAPTGKVLQTESTEKLIGTVRSINRVNFPDHVQIQMVLSTDQGDKLIIVGPANYIDQQRVKFATGDRVTVTGYRIIANGQEIITAARIQRNGTTLQLLNEQRQPMWGPQQQQESQGSSWGQQWGWGSRWGSQNW
jgi:hypothetical protein